MNDRRPVQGNREPSDATAILQAIMAGQEFADAGVPDTPHNRQVWESMKQDVAAVPPGAVVDVPFDWAE